MSKYFSNLKLFIPSLAPTLKLGASVREGEYQQVTNQMKVGWA
jgi:hypothetical protein